VVSRLRNLKKLTAFKLSLSLACLRWSYCRLLFHLGTIFDSTWERNFRPSGVTSIARSCCRTYIICLTSFHPPNSKLALRGEPKSWFWAWRLCSFRSKVTPHPRMRGTAWCYLHRGRSLVFLYFLIAFSYSTLNRVNSVDRILRNQNACPRTCQPCKACPTARRGDSGTRTASAIAVAHWIS